MRKLKLTGETIKIYKMLDFYLRYVPLGLLPFFDAQYPLPTSRDIAEVLNALHASDDLGVRISGGETVPEAQRIAECMEPFNALIDHYGIEKIREVCQAWEARYPNKGKMIRCWSAKDTGGIYTMSDVAESSGFTDPSVPYRVRRAYLMDIAYDIYVSRYVLVPQEARC